MFYLNGFTEESQAKIKNDFRKIFGEQEIIFTTDEVSFNMYDGKLEENNISKILERALNISNADFLRLSDKKPFMLFI